MIRIVGAGPGTAKYLTGEARSVIDSSRLLAGGKRVLDELAVPQERRLELPDGMAEAVISMLEREEQGGITLVVSGDPGFYSLAKKVVSYFGRERVSVMPGISSVQIMAARLCRSWAGIASVTLHGRARPGISELAVRLENAPALAVLFGSPAETAAHISWMAASTELSAAWAAIGWDLGLADERVFEYDSLKELEGCTHKGRLGLLWLEKTREGSRRDRG